MTKNDHKMIKEQVKPSKYYCDTTVKIVIAQLPVFKLAWQQVKAY